MPAGRRCENWAAQGIKGWAQHAAAWPSNQRSVRLNNEKDETANNEKDETANNEKDEGPSLWQKTFRLHSKKSPLSGEIIDIYLKRKSIRPRGAKETLVKCNMGQKTSSIVDAAFEWEWSSASAGA